jgi:hypothetical protein
MDDKEIDQRFINGVLIMAAAQIFARFADPLFFVLVLSAVVAVPALWVYADIGGLRAIVMGGRAWLLRSLVIAVTAFGTADAAHIGERTVRSFADGGAAEAMFVQPALGKEEPKPTPAPDDRTIFKPIIRWTMAYGTPRRYFA